ncbi:MAG: cation:proton antiporter [Bacteroidales bacterium]|nr:cation:proton antiporter [Candidatus Colimorpha merdihippi]
MTYIFLGLLIFCAHLFNAWFSSRRIPDVLLLMGIGIIAGPVTGWISPDSMKDIGPVLASLTLLFILFDSGTDMRLDTVRKYWSGVVQVTFLSFMISMVTTTITGITLMGLTWQTSLILGAMVSGTAAAIVIPLVRQMRVSDKTRVTLTLESAISGMMCIVITLVLIEGFKLGNINVGSLIGRVLASILMAAIIGIVGGIVWSSIMERVRKLQNSMFMTPAFVFVIYGVTELLGYSGAIASLAFGLVLGNPSYFEMSFLHKLKFGKTTPLMESEKSFFKEFVFILKTYFFVYIGLCIPFHDVWALIYGGILAAILFAVRFILIAVVGRENTPNDRLIVSMMIPKGLVSAVLASIPEQLNIAAGCIIIHHATFIKQITYSVIFFSIVFCSLLVLATRNRLMKGNQELADAPPSSM